MFLNHIIWNTKGKSFAINSEYIYIEACAFLEFKFISIFTSLQTCQ